MCNYTFIKYAGDRQQAKAVGGAIFTTECGNIIYGLELSKGKCIFCNAEIVAKDLDPLHRKFGDKNEKMESC